MKTRSVCVRGLIFVFFLAGVHCRVDAQGIAFTNDAALLKDVSALRTEGNDLDVFRGGDAVWGVLKAAPKFKDIKPYTSELNGASVVRVEVSLRNEFQNFDVLFKTALPVTAEQMQASSVSFPIVPDTFDLALPGLERLLHRIPDHKKRKMLFKVRIEGSEKTGGNYIQSGFIIDLADGQGRFGDWIKQKDSIDSVKAAATEKPLIASRTQFVANFVAARDDARFSQDIAKWWNSGKSSPNPNPILKAVACSDYDIVRNSYGVVLSKQSCGLMVHQRGSDGKCFVQWRKFGYESIGGSFDTQLKSWTPQDLHFNMGKEKLDVGKPYELDCNAAGR